MKGGNRLDRVLRPVGDHPFAERPVTDGHGSRQHNYLRPAWRIGVLLRSTQTFRCGVSRAGWMGAPSSRDRADRTAQEWWDEWQATTKFWGEVDKEEEEEDHRARQEQWDKLLGRAAKTATPKLPQAKTTRP